MKNLLKTVSVIFVLVLAFSACVTVGEGSGGAGGSGTGGGGAGSSSSGAAAGTVAEDGSMMLITGATAAGWHSEHGVVSMRDGNVTFTGTRQGDTYWINGRYRFARRMDVSAYTNGYLQMEIMVSDIRMMDAPGAALQLSSADFNYVKWRFNDIGSYEDGYSPQVPSEAGVWTTVTVPLYKSSWEDQFIDNGLNHARVDRFDLFLIGSPVDGTIQIRNIRAVNTP